MDPSWNRAVEKPRLVSDTSQPCLFLVSWRTWSLAVRATVHLVQPMVRAPPLAPSPLLSLLVGRPQAVPARARLSPPWSPRPCRSLPLCQHPCLHFPLQRFVELSHLLLTQSQRPRHWSPSSPPLRLEPQSHRSAASCLAGLVLLLPLKHLLAHQVNVLHVSLIFYVLLLFDPQPLG